MSYALTLKEKIPFEANAWKVLTLPKYPCITEIDLKVKLSVSAGTSVSANADAPYSILKAIQVVRGGDYLINADGYRLFAKNWYEYGGQIKTDTLPAANQSKDVVFALVIHPGYNVNRKDDNSVAINTMRETQLKVLWGSESDLGSGYTISSGEIEVTVWFRTDVTPQREPVWELTTKTIDRLYDDLGLRVGFPIGKWTPKAVIVTRDSNGNRSDGIITEIGIVDERYGYRIPHRISAEEQKYDDQRRYRASPLTGVYILDAAEISRTAFYGVSGVYIGFTTAVSSGSIDILFPSHL